MGDFFSDARNGPTILLIILVVDVVVVLGAFALISRIVGGRILKRSGRILRLAAAGATDRARELAETWDRGSRPRSPLARINLAKIWSVLGEHHRALGILDTTRIPNSRACRPLRRAASHLRFDVLRALGEHERADWLLRDQAAADPSAPWLVTARWEAAQGSEDPIERGVALADVRARFAAHPKDESVLAVLAQEALTDHRYADAADLLERLIRRLDRPGARRLTMPDVHLVLGMARLAAGRDADADAAFRTYLASADDPVAAERRVLGTKAAALLTTRRLREATEIYEQLATGEGAADAFAGLAMCLVRQGDPRAADDALRRAEEAGFPVEKARFLRSQILVDLGRSEEADRLATAAAADRAEADPEALYTLAYVRATGHRPEAEATLRRYVQVRPNDPDLPALLDRAAPGGGTWRERLAVAPRPDR